MAQTPAALLTGAPGEPWRPVAVLTTGFGHGARPPSRAGGGVIIGSACQH